MENYTDIYNRMKSKYEELSGNGFSEASETAVKLKVLAGEIFNAQTELEWTKRQMFASTAEGEYLDHIALTRGIQRRSAKKARGVLRFSLDETLSTPVIIPAGTTVATSEPEPQRYRTTADAEIPAMTLSVNVPAEAEQSGYAGNALIGTVNVPVSVPAAVSAVGNYSAFTGGADAESDNALRQRIKDSYICAVNGANRQFYIELAKSVEGVDKVSVLPRSRGMGTLDIYVCGSGGTISNETLAEAARIIEENRELGVDIQVIRGYPLDFDLTATVKGKPGYTSQEIVSALTNAFEDYLDSVPMGGKVYLSALGKFLLDTGCIENYEFDLTMTNSEAPASQFFVKGEVSIGVT